MKMLQTAKKLILAMLIVALVALPSTLAVGWAHPSYAATDNYRIGAYSAIYRPHQGMYDYIAPPTMLTRYGAQYHVSNVRWAGYNQDFVSYMPSLHAPYRGYPYGSYGNYHFERYRSGYWHAR
jgi:hypothetical protein